MAHTWVRWASLGIFATAPWVLHGCNDVLGIRGGATPEQTVPWDAAPSDGSDGAPWDGPLVQPVRADSSLAEASIADAVTADALADAVAPDSASADQGARDVSEDVGERGPDDGAALPDALGLDGPHGAEDARGQDAGDSLTEVGQVCSGKMCSAGCVAADDPKYGCSDATCSPCGVAGDHSIYACQASSCAKTGCEQGYKLCGGVCVAADVAHGCGGTCTACPSPAHATASCDGAQACALKCEDGYKLCGGKCVSVTDPSYGCTKDSCSAEACPNHAATDTLVCAGTACVIGKCGDGTKNCDGNCVPIDSNHGCASPSSCAPCSTTERCSGSPSACTCVPEDKAITCAAGSCGTRKNNCGQTVTCDDCKLPQTCGGGGVALTCGCTAKSPCDVNHCGVQTDSCGASVSCSFNTCGGCGALPGAVGARCTGASGCEGTFVCSGTSMVCNAPAKNACGGCGPLPGPVGGSCTGSSGCTGAYACSGTSMVCNAMAKNMCGMCAPASDCNYCVCTNAAVGCGNGGRGAYYRQFVLNVPQRDIPGLYGPGTGWTCFAPSSIRGSGGPNACRCPTSCGFGGYGGDKDTVDLGLSSAEIVSSHYGPGTGWFCGPLQ